MDFLEKSTMNLKEGFRYQNFLNTLMAEAETYLFSDDHFGDIYYSFIWNSVHSLSIDKKRSYIVEL